MIWILVVYLLGFDGDKIRTPLKPSYETFQECKDAKKVVEEAVEPYWPNPEANVRKIEVICITERPFGN